MQYDAANKIAPERFGGHFFLPNTLFNKIQCHLFASALEIVAEVGYL